MRQPSIVLKAVCGLFAAGCLAIGTAAQADTFSINMTEWHYFYASTSPDFHNLNHNLEVGGNMHGILNGESLAGAYCVDLFTNIYDRTQYTGTVVTGDGMIYGSPINNAGKISWLLSNYGQRADTPDEENALQAAIWRVQNGTKFELDGADNTKTGNSANLINLYQSYLTNLGNNNAPLSSVLWISPYASTSNLTHYQGVVGLRRQSQSVPEPGALTLLFAGISAIGVVRRKRL